MIHYSPSTMRNHSTILYAGSNGNYFMYKNDEYRSSFYEEARTLKLVYPAYGSHNVYRMYRQKTYWNVYILGSMK